MDVITPSTESTSVLSDASQVGVKKTRAMAVWAERRGFETVITERAFGLNSKRLSDDPPSRFAGSTMPKAAVRSTTLGSTS